VGRAGGDEDAHRGSLQSLHFFSGMLLYASNINERKCFMELGLGEYAPWTTATGEGRV
jgi:hypothetical protein